VAGLEKSLWSVTFSYSPGSRAEVTAITPMADYRLIGSQAWPRSPGPPQSSLLPGPPAHVQRQPIKAQCPPEWWQKEPQLCHLSWASLDMGRQSDPPCIF
jgi:hypothetical protein